MKYIFRFWSIFVLLISVFCSSSLLSSNSYALDNVELDVLNKLQHQNKLDKIDSSQLRDIIEYIMNESKSGNINEEWLLEHGFDEGLLDKINKYDLDMDIKNILKKLGENNGDDNDVIIAEMYQVFAFWTAVISICFLIPGCNFPAI